MPRSVPHHHPSFLCSFSMPHPCRALKAPMDRITRPGIVEVALYRNPFYKWEQEKIPGIQPVRLWATLTAFLELSPIAGIQPVKLGATLAACLKFYPAPICRTDFPAMELVRLWGTLAAFLHFSPPPICRTDSLYKSTSTMTRRAVPSMWLSHTCHQPFPQRRPHWSVCAW